VYTERAHSFMVGRPAYAHMYLNSNCLVFTLVLADLVRCSEGTSLNIAVAGGSAFAKLANFSTNANLCILQFCASCIHLTLH